jgi:HemY protein
VAATGLLRGLALELISGAHDPDQMNGVWNQLDPTEKQMPEVAIAATRRMLKLGGDVAVTRDWLLPLWDRMVARPVTLSESQRVQLIQVLESGFGMVSGAPEGVWLTRIEKAQMADPGDAALQYLAGIACKHLQLWGKAQLLLKQSLPRLQDPGLERSAHVALAELAEQRGDVVAATQAWRNAALSFKA